MGDIGPTRAHISVVIFQYVGMVIAVEKFKLVTHLFDVEKSIQGVPKLGVKQLTFTVSNWASSSIIISRFS